MRRGSYIIAILTTLLAVGGAGAVSSGHPPGAVARAYGIQVIVPGKPGGSAVNVSAPIDTVGLAGSFAYPADGSLVSVQAGSITASVSADAGIATASSQIASLSLFGGEVTATGIVARAHAAATAVAATGDQTGSGVADLSYQGVSLGSAAGAHPLGDWGTATILEQGVDQSGAPASYRGYVTALDIHLSADHGGLPAGSEVLVGYAEASAQVGTVQPAPKPPVQVLPRPIKTPKAGKAAPAKAPEPNLNPIGPVLQPPSVTPKLTAGGYVFPVYGPSSFSDTFGAFRGDVPGNWHHGDDIFAPLGAPLLACATGTVFSVGWNPVGGNRLWLRDSQGNEFYYAHLSAFTPLAKNNNHVQAGDVLGFVGNTGDASGTPYHLHFEVHPVSLLGLGYDGAVNPTAYLTAWQHLQDVRFDAAGGWAPAGHSTAPQPGAILLQVSDISSADGLRPTSLQQVMSPLASEGDAPVFAYPATNGNRAPPSRTVQSRATGGTPYGAPAGH